MDPNYPNLGIEALEQLHLSGYRGGEIKSRLNGQVYRSRFCVFQSWGGLSEVAWDVKVFNFHSKRWFPKLDWVD
jgi:hypothetical protein